jgi:hypothetical protein
VTTRKIATRVLDAALFALVVAVLGVAAAAPFWIPPLVDAAGHAAEAAARAIRPRHVASPPPWPLPPGYGLKPPLDRRLKQFRPGQTAPEAAGERHEVTP